MENNNHKKVRRKIRQQWNPHWLIKLGYSALSLALSAAKVAVLAGATVVLIVLICGTVFAGILGDYLSDDILTAAENWSLEDYDLERTSFIYYVDKGGNIQQLQQIYTTTDRQWASLDEIPKALRDAAVAIEDKRFYEHQGVDWITTVKACLNMFFGGDSQFGGSTITQQLVKNTSDEKSVTVQRKVMEIFRAQMFEREYDKNLIMEQYLNRIYLGKGCYGVKSAAAKYFGKELQTLTVAECASLISITNNPSLFNPYSTRVFTYKGEERDGAGRNRYRQLNVLNEMLEQGYLSQEEYETAVEQPMVFKDGIDDNDRWTYCQNLDCGYKGPRSTFQGSGDFYYCPICGEMTSVTTNASQHIYSWFVDAVIIDFASYLAKQDGRNWDVMNKEARDIYLDRIQKGGYHIYTTLDMEVQNQVDAVYNNPENLPHTNSAQQLQSAIVVIDNRTGDVVALSGGVGEKTTFLGYHRATQAKLQTGSSQKPISVYAPAFESGRITPATVVKDLPFSYSGGTPWPKNDSRTYNYSRTVYQGIVSSINAVAVRTLDQIGTEYSFSFSKYNFGLNHLVDSYRAANGENKSDVALAPLALGALTVGSTVQEMSAAYATFANNGVYREPRLYTKVYNSEGKLVVDNTQYTQKILSEKTVNYMNYCLYNAANNGTGGAAIFPGQYIAGKTGTTSSNKDRWFCGFTSHYTAAVWVGYDRPEQIYVNTANPAAIMWRKVMQPIHQGLPNQGLFNGNAFRQVAVCLDSGKLATNACYDDVRGDRVAYVNVYPGDEPAGTCDKHVRVDYCVTGGGVATEYCSLSPDAHVSSRSLVRLNAQEVNEIRSAVGVGLNGMFFDDGYVYYTDGDWYGFSGNCNYAFNEPYRMCTVHNADTWSEPLPWDEDYAELPGDEGWGFLEPDPGFSDDDDDGIFW